MDTQKTKVIFRKWNKAIDHKQGIIAIFPEEIATMSISNCDSWERMGEYGDINVWSPCVLKRVPRTATKVRSQIIAQL